MRTSQRLALGSLITIGAVALAVSATAQTYPTRPIRIITAGPGTFHDIVTRSIGQRLSERWGQSIVVENNGAAGGTIGTSLAAKSAPDGYTLLMADRTSLAAAPSLYKSLQYDPIRDLAPITLVATSPLMLIAHLSVPAADLREFIDYAKRRPGAINFAAAGNATTTHMTGELLKHATGIDVVTVHYKGGGPAVIAIVSGEAAAGFSALPNALPHVTAGRVKAYAVTSKRRFAGLPEIPTIDEAGLRGFESEQWIGILAPVRTPADLVARLNREIVEILQTPVMRDMLRLQGAEPAPGSPEEFGSFIKSETSRLRKVIELTGMRVE